VASEITLSPIHKVAMDKIRKGSGLALRFPKFTGKIRFEKTSENATSIEEITTLYNSQKRVVQDEKIN
jgi:DNA ligase-1